MNRSLALLAGCGLLLTIVPSVLYFLRLADLDATRHLMSLGMIVWFTADLARVVRRNTSP